MSRFARDLALMSFLASGAGCTLPVTVGDLDADSGTAGAAGAEEPCLDITWGHYVVLDYF